MSVPYKIAYIEKGNEISSIYVFYNNIDTTPAELGALFASQPENELFARIFSEDEKAMIQSKNIPVRFTEHEIHLDDTIETIKKKCMMVSEKEISFGELYLFAQQKEQLDSVSVYQNLTQNGSIELTKDRLIQFLLNINDIDIESLPVKEVYDYNDILSLDFEKGPSLINKPIGQKFIAVETTYPYTVNPFNVLIYDPFLERFADKLTTTTNQNLLMNTGNIFNNTIYMCSAEDVLKNAEELSLSEESTIKIYFPYLLDNDIISLSQLKAKQITLLSESEKMISSNFERQISNINLFYNIFKNRKSDLEYKQRGLINISFIIHPTFSFNLPLDVVFKLIHATREVPFIKYNPGKRQEKMYRLYAPEVATNGKKIPYLPKSLIFKLVRTVGKTKRVSLYIQPDDLTPLICEFETNGAITVKASFSRSVSSREINTIIQQSINPQIEIIRDYLSQSGYSIDLFESIRDKNIEIINMQYNTDIAIKKKFNLKPYVGCISSVFNIISHNSEESVLRYKRVANYNEMDSIEAYIIELLNNGASETDTIQGILTNFPDYTPEKARAKVSDFVSSLQVVQNMFQNKKLKIKNNPGFLTTISKDKFDNTLKIIVSGINQFSYLDTIPIYIDSILRLTQDIKSTNIAPEVIKKLCSGKQVAEEETIVDIVAPVEQAQPEQKQLAFVAEEIRLTEPDDEEAPQDDILDILMGSDDEDDDEEDEEDEEEGEGVMEQVGGVDSDDLEVKVEGMSLSNPNPLFKRMTQRDPTLFLTEDEGKFKAYSRICQWNIRKQPVILTDEEKEKIDKEHPGSYDEAIKYGSSKDKQHWYICPRYWSLKDNISLTQEQVDSGDYGKLIPKNAKVIGKDETILQLDSQREHRDEKGNYITHYPGFYKLDGHPNGKCIPCCMRAWDSPEQNKRRTHCASEMDESIPSPRRQDSDVADEYIQGAEKFPLPQNRYGFLPIAIQKFLRTDNKKCQISVSNTNIKPNHPCILRHGVESSKTQSFISCIADIWIDVTNDQMLSIKEMKKILVNAVNIDNYMTFQNGTLIDIFDNNAEVDINKYKDSKIYKNVNLSNPEELSTLRKIARSFENYINFMNDDSIIIDYTYLWDLICFPNPDLFTQGVNMVILELKNDDITDNVNLLCPTNHYSNTFFDVNKKTIILLKIGQYYEPIFSFEDKKSRIEIIRRFSLKQKNVLPNIRATLEFIKNTYNSKCSPLPSLPKIYKFKTNIVLSRLVYLLKLKNYEIKSQILNYNGKVVGIIVQKDSVRGYIPCFPSSPLIDLTSHYTWIDDAIGENYVKTRSFLEEIYKISNGNIPCKPVIKIIEDGLIVGILTQTNQFVPINPPEQDTYGEDLEMVDGNNYIIGDEISLTSDKKDKERIEYIQKIRLESNFFNVFRNTIRIMLGQFKYREIREDIESVSSSDSMTYLSKLRFIDEKIRTLLKDVVVFSEYDESVIQELKQITNCYEDTDESCKEKKFCISKEDNNCALVIPKINLINQQDNEKVYFGRIADEIIRYNRIKLFIFKPKAFLTFSTLKYNLRKDEVILLQSLLTQDYFDDLTVSPVNEYVKYNSYDSAQPLKTQAYSSSMDLGTVEEEKDTIDCGIPKKHILSNKSKWKKSLPQGSIELEFSNDPPSCSFYLIFTLIKQSNPKMNILNINDLKEILIEEYLILSEEYENNILQILSSQGKKKMIQQVSKGQSTLGNIIMSNDYYATNLDIWVLAFKFNIPLIFISATKLIENNKSLFVANSNDRRNFYFIKSPGIRVDNIPKYKLIVLENGTSLISIDLLSLELQKEINDTIRKNALIEYISTFTPPKPPPKKPKLLIRE